MALLATTSGLPLADAPDLNIYVAGAESNVASGLAHLGHGAEWFGRVGRDPFGSRVLESLHARGVATPHVVEDPVRPTGLYIKDVGTARTPVYYYRRGSAASAMSAPDIASMDLACRRLCHVSGITAALSDSCDELLTQLVTARRPSGPVISFDVNYRRPLWDVAVAGPRLAALASHADIVIVGRDEAETLWGTSDPLSVRELFANVPQLVVKDDAAGATVFVGPDQRFVPALAVDVVEPVGAGDAFAAGYLSAWIRGDAPETGLRMGHLMAALTLLHVSDLPPLPDATLFRSLAAVSDPEWAALDVATVAGIQA